MKTNVIREAVRHEPRTQSPIRTRSPARATPRAAPSEWAWPGITRAELREMVIEQIG